MAGVRRHSEEAAVIVDFPHSARLDLVERGWSRVAAAIDPSICASLLLEADDPRWNQLDPQVGSVRMAGWWYQPAPDEVPAAAVELAQRLADTLLTVLDGLAMPPQFNEISWQRHVPDNHAVTVHRDQSVYKGVIAVVTLAGAARFAIHESQEGPILDGWDTETGDVVILRGSGLAGPESPRPWHSVGAPGAGQRQTLTLRHSTREQGWW